jgi:hypothetical protein
VFRFYDLNFCGCIGNYHVAVCVMTVVFHYFSIL